MAVFHTTDQLPSFRNAVITIGTFDGVHQGHMMILEEVVRAARDLNGESIVITFEPHPRKLLHPEQALKLITPLEEKLGLLKQTGIDHVVVAPFTREFANLSAREYIDQFLVKLFHPSCIIIGYDHHFGHDRTGNIGLLKQLESEYKFTVVEIPAQLIEEAAVSSTKIRKALQSGQVEEASSMMGRPYSLRGKVVEGAKLGRTIGYPTANIQPCDGDQIIPGVGVYAVWVNWKGASHAAMLNIGYRPTVTEERTLTIEAHLLDFNEDLYGEVLELVFVARLRDELKFSSLEALKQQLGRDREEASKVLGG